MFHEQLSTRGDVASFRVRWVRQDPVLWRVPIHAGDSSLAVVGYSEPTSAYVVHRIDEDSGFSIWTRTLPVGGYGSPAVLGNQLAVLTDHVGVALLDWTTGRQLNLFRQDSRIRSSVATDDDAFWFTAADRFYRLVPNGIPEVVNRSDGVSLFGLPVHGPSGWVSLYVRRLAHGVGAVGVAQLGKEGWHTDLAQGAVASSDTSGVAQHDGLLFACAGRTLSAVDPADGRLVWQQQLPGPTTRSAPLVIGELVLVADTAGTATALAQATGDVLWQRMLAPEEGIWSPLSASSQHVMAIAGGQLLTLDLRTGEQKSRLPVGHSPYSALTYSPTGFATVGGGDPPYFGLLAGLDPAPLGDWSELTVAPDRWRVRAWRDGVVVAVRTVDLSVVGGGVCAVGPDGTFEAPPGPTHPGSYAVPVRIAEGGATLARLDVPDHHNRPRRVELDVSVAPAVDEMHSGAAILASALGSPGPVAQRRIRLEAEQLIAVSERQPWDIWRLAARQILHDPPTLPPA